MKGCCFKEYCYILVSMDSFTLSGNDAELLTASRNGDQQAFRKLFDKYWNDLFKIACKRLRSTEDAQDILQEVFLSLWNNIETIVIQDSLGGYLYTALRNKIFNHFEKKSSRLAKLMSTPFNVVESEETILSNYCTKELQEFIARQITTMPEKMRQVFLLSKEEQLSHAEIVSLLQVSEQTVKNQLHNAVKRLKSSLKQSDFPFTTILPVLLFLK